MTYILFGVRLAAHLWRFNSSRGPFGPSVFWQEPLWQDADAQKDKSPGSVADRGVRLPGSVAGR